MDDRNPLDDLTETDDYLSQEIPSFRKFSEIQPKPIKWLWPMRLARGKVSLIAGHPGLGKSQVTLSMAATVSTGGLWPVDELPCRAGNVVLLSAEDDAADTLAPRLMAAGADLSRVYILDAVHDEDADGRLIRRGFSLKRDLDRLESMLHEIGGAAMIVIDPITAYLDGTDSHKNAEVRAMLAPLAELAATHSAAVVGVTHLNKSGGTEAMMRLSGSTAFVAAARAAYIVVKDPEDDLRRLMLPVKNNIGEDRTGFAFSIETHQLPNGIQTSRVVWGPDLVEVSADEAMRPMEDPDTRSATDEAIYVLSDLLQRNGAMKSTEAKKKLKGEGFSDKCIRRAREKLGVLARRREFDGGTWWSLPE